MIRVQYTASRDLSGLHTPGAVVALSFSCAELTPGRRVVRDIQKALGGQRETLYHHALRTWAVTTGPLGSDALDAVLEFLASAEGGESFTFEPWRVETAPSLDVDFVTPRLRSAEAVNCILDSEGYSLTRLIGDGTGGADDWYQVNFSVEEVPA